MARARKLWVVLAFLSNLDSFLVVLADPKRHISAPKSENTLKRLTLNAVADSGNSRRDKATDRALSDSGDKLFAPFTTQFLSVWRGAIQRFTRIQMNVAYTWTMLGGDEGV
ncbi:hypothetical protein EDB84DRAFT_1526261 [Lactarius hengduanensis]|nr:hypothetical protein EDB84DRAFT_1526261 [Lactarius hengduanensis]